MIVDKIVKRENNNLKNKKSKIDIPVGKWIKCEACKEILYKESVRENYSICPNCGHYFRMHINKRLESTIDEGTYKRFNLNLDTVNPLNLEDYPKKLKVLREKTKIEEAVACGTGKINGEDVVICVMDSGFMMGSMGAVVGEKITYSIEQAIKLKLPFIMFAVSGGARMQEGIISLMQMAKTTAALTKLDNARTFIYIYINWPNIWRGYSIICKFGRYYTCWARSNDRICGKKSNRANNWRKITRRFPNCRIFIRTWLYW